MPTYNWYDPAGNLIKTETGGVRTGSGEDATWTGPFQETTYDALGRPVLQYTGYNNTPETSADLYDTSDNATAGQATLDLGNDTILQQTQTWYDPAGEPVAAATYERFADDAPVTGTVGATFLHQQLRHRLGHLLRRPRPRRQPGRLRPRGLALLLRPQPLLHARRRRGPRLGRRQPALARHVAKLHGRADRLRSRSERRLGHRGRFG